MAFEETEAGIVVREVVSEDRFEKWRGAAETDRSAERMAELRGEGP